jgi:hypothetical protein
MYSANDIGVASTANIDPTVPRRPDVRKYTNNSPEAGARVVALALMADGAIDRNERLLLERQNVIAQLGLNNEQFDAIYYAYCTDVARGNQ